MCQMFSPSIIRGSEVSAQHQFLEIRKRGVFITQTLCFYLNTGCFAVMKRGIFSMLGNKQEYPLRELVPCPGNYPRVIFPSPHKVTYTFSQDNSRFSKPEQESSRIVNKLSSKSL